MPKISYEVKGLAKVKRALNRIKVKMMDLSPVWPAVREEFYNIEKKRFESENKGRWKPLSDKYAAWKEANYPGKPIMVLTGNLKRTLTSLTTGSVYNPTRRDVTLGTKVRYALTHQHGDRSRKIPARPLIRLIKSDMNRIKKIMGGYLDTMIGKNR